MACNTCWYVNDLAYKSAKDKEAGEDDVCGVEKISDGAIKKHADSTDESSKLKEVESSEARRRLSRGPLLSWLHESYVLVGIRSLLPRLVLGRLLLRRLFLRTGIGGLRRRLLLRLFLVLLNRMTCLSVLVRIWWLGLLALVLLWRLVACMWLLFKRARLCRCGIWRRRAPLVLLRRLYRLGVRLVALLVMLRMLWLVRL